MNQRNTRVAVCRKMDQYAVLSALAADPAGWRGAGDYPSTVVCRLLTALADWAAAEPAAWRASRLRFEHPSWSAAKVAAVLAVPVAEARAAMEPAPLCTAEPAVRRTADGAPASLTYRRAVLLAERASTSPTQWRVWRLRFTGMPQRQAAEILGVSQQRVSQLLRRPLLPPEPES